MRMTPSRGFSAARLTSSFPIRGEKLLLETPRVSLKLSRQLFYPVSLVDHVQ